MLKHWGAAALLLFGTVQTTVAADDDVTRVRVVHALQGGQAVNVSIAGQQLFQNVQYKQVTEYKTITSDDDLELTITTADGTAVAIDGDNEVDDDDSMYTIVIMANKDNNATKPAVKIHETDHDDDDTDEAHISLINASNGVGAADLFVGDNKVHAGVNSGGLNGPDGVKPGSHQVRIHNSRDNQDVVSQSMNLEGGKSYTAIVFTAGEGRLIDDSNPAAAGSAMGAAAASTATTGTLGSAARATTGTMGSTNTIDPAPATMGAATQGMNPSDSAAQQMSGSTMAGHGATTIDTQTTPSM